MAGSCSMHWRWDAAQRHSDSAQTANLWQQTGRVANRVSMFESLVWLSCDLNCSLLHSKLPWSHGDRGCTMSAEDGPDLHLMKAVHLLQWNLSSLALGFSSLSISYFAFFDNLTPKATQNHWVAKFNSQLFLLPHHTVFFQIDCTPGASRLLNSTLIFNCHNWVKPLISQKNVHNIFSQTDYPFMSRYITVQNSGVQCKKKRKKKKPNPPPPPLLL